MAQKRSSTSKTAKSTTAKSKPSSSRTAASRKAAASKGGKATARKTTARKSTARKPARSKTTASKPAAGGVEAKSVAELREALRKNLIRPMDMVMISRERIEEVLGEAVDQGRVTARDAQRITSGLVKRGQRQTSDVLKDLENLLGRGRNEIGGARGRAVRTASPALAQVDKVRRGAGVGPSFPITGYDDLTAAQITSRLGSLRPAELRKVRDHERRNANRKTVIGAIESKLG
jgi:polyhydroxyalkanoate synthesis regulator phasin